MKKLFVLVACAVLSLGAFAQNKLSWEVEAGMNLAKMNVTGYDSRVGFHAGIRGKYELSSLTDGLYANAGAFLSLKGASVDWGDLASSKCNAYYLEVPVHLGYQYAVNDNFSVFGEFGPYFAYGLFGNTSASSMDFEDGESTSESHSTFDELKRFDFGLGLRVGVEIRQRYTFSVGYDMGLANIWDKGYWSDDDYDYDEEIYAPGSVKNRNLTITLGYKF